MLLLKLAGGQTPPRPTDRVGRDPRLPNLVSHVSMSAWSTRLAILGEVLPRGPSCASIAVSLRHAWPPQPLPWLLICRCCVTPAHHHAFALWWHIRCRDSWPGLQPDACPACLAQGFPSRHHLAFACPALAVMALDGPLFDARHLFEPPTGPAVFEHQLRMMGMLAEVPL